MSDANRESILIIDDDQELADILSVVLESQGYEAQSCADPGEAIALVRTNRFSLLLLDLRLGETNGLQLLPRLRELDPEVPVFIITAHGDVDSAVQAFRIGANGYIRKPFQDGELRLQISQAVEAYRLKRAVRSAENPVTLGVARTLLLTRDPAMEPVLRAIEAASQVNSSVVVTGESGTGKELVARALHSFGARKNGPFIAFNCGALPETLLESELFGHARGAFTDARESKPGLFQRAHGGTLFLDEIGDAPASIQLKLLRALQEREVTPLGASASVKVDVRVIAATHRSLQDEVRAGRFRQDLYFRIHVLPIQVPPLRERKRDIAYLGTVFARRLSEELSVPFEGFTDAAREELERHDWPGNVRELQNRIEHALAMNAGSGAGMISARALFPENTAALPAEGSGPGLSPYHEAKSRFERDYLEQVLRAARGNITRAAR
ncbi:MAG: sigma-54-dependent transcriptional regulator, partial [Bdellovibrionota bacterium]